MSPLVLPAQAGISYGTHNPIRHTTRQREKLRRASYACLKAISCCTSHTPFLWTPGQARRDGMDFKTVQQKSRHPGLDPGSMARHQKL